MSQKAILLCITGVFLFNISGIYCQQPPDTESTLRYWGQGGAATTSLGPGLAGSVTLDQNNHLFTLRAINTNLRFTDYDTWEIAFLYGRGYRRGNVHLSAGAGVAVIGGKKYAGLFGGEPAVQAEPMIGFPLGGEIAWTATRFAAIVFYGFANVNTNQPVGGIGLALRLGKVR